MIPKVVFEKNTVEAPGFSALLLLFSRFDLCAVIISGSMDTNIVDRLHNRTTDLAAGRRLDYVVDLDAVTYISSTGLGYLMNLLKQKKEHVYLSNPGPAVLKPFSLFDIKHLFRYYRSLDDLAVSSALPGEVVAVLRDQKGLLKAATPRRRGLEILADYLENEDELHEIQRMTPYIHSARYRDAINLPAEDRFVGVLYKFLERAFQRFKKQGGPAVDEATVEMISKELMTNAIKHGYSNRPGGVVEVAYVLDQPELTITFTDQGRGYDPSSRPLEALPPTGLEMLRRVFDRVEIGPPPAEGQGSAKGTSVRLVMLARTGPHH